MFASANGACCRALYLLAPSRFSLFYFNVLLKSRIKTDLKRRRETGRTRFDPVEMLHAADTDHRCPTDSPFTVHWPGPDEHTRRVHRLQRHAAADGPGDHRSPPGYHGAAHPTRPRGLPAAQQPHHPHREPVHAGGHPELLHRQHQHQRAAQRHRVHHQLHLQLARVHHLPAASSAGAPQHDEGGDEGDEDDDGGDADDDDDDDDSDEGDDDGDEDDDGGDADDDDDDSDEGDDDGDVDDDGGDADDDDDVEEDGDDSDDDDDDEDGGGDVDDDDSDDGNDGGDEDDDGDADDGNGDVGDEDYDVCDDGGDGNEGDDGGDEDTDAMIQTDKRFKRTLI